MINKFPFFFFFVGDFSSHSFFSAFRFYTEALGMQLLRKRDVPEEKYSNAFLGFGPEESHFVVELTYSTLLKLFNSFAANFIVS